MRNTILFIHGAWLTPRSWEPFLSYFEPLGYTCLAPTWPHKDLPIEELRAHPPAELAGLGITEIVDHYARVIEALPEPPILIGHSFGGLFVQLLLDRGLGKAGVAIDPAPPKGVLPLSWTAIKSSSSVFFKWMAWDRVVTMSFEDFASSFANTLSPEAQRAAYEAHIVPETGRIFFQAVLAVLDPHSAAEVNVKNNTRAPLLLTAGLLDHTVPPGFVRSNYKLYEHTSARTDLLEFPGRSHWIIAQEGWEEVAASIHNWLTQVI